MTNFGKKPDHELHEFYSQMTRIFKKYALFNKAQHKYAKKFLAKYGTVRYAGTSRTIRLEDIYVKLNVIEKIASRSMSTRNGFEDTRKQSHFEKIKQTRDSDELLESALNIMLVGKSGSGKTTLLRHIAIQLVTKKLDRIPVLIELAAFAENGEISLLDYIVEEFNHCFFESARPFIERNLKKGKFIFLMDGLDEVSVDRLNWVFVCIRDFTDKYHMNRFIIASRTLDHRHQFETFDDVEISDFDLQQIERFIRNWFGDPEKAAACYENIRKNKKILDLAAHPLSSRILCSFYDKMSRFPKNRIELYSVLVEQHMRGLNAAKTIHTRQTPYDISDVADKIVLKIAFSLFKKKKFVFSRHVLEYEMQDFFRLSPGAATNSIHSDVDFLINQIQNEMGIIQEIAYGMYSFSHITFQEYLCAKFLADMNDEEQIKTFVTEFVFEKRWRQVFLHLSGLLEDPASFFLWIQEKINNYAFDPKNNILTQIFENLDRLAKNRKTSPKERIYSFYLMIFYAEIKLDINESSGAPLAERDGEHVFLPPTKNNIASLAALTSAEEPFRKVAKNAGALLNYFKAEEDRPDFNTLEIETKTLIVIGHEDLPILQNFLDANKLLLDCLQNRVHLTKRQRMQIFKNIFPFSAQKFR